MRGRWLIGVGVLVAAFAAAYLPAARSAVGTEPLAARQWYIAQDRAWDFWRTRPRLPAVRVAVIDSGLDAGHPEFAGRVVAGKSFVGGSWSRDTEGHGTFVAGVIAADPSNGVGIAGIGFNVELLIAKVVADDGEVSPEAEAAAIRWAVGQGARVINLSIGGQRVPDDPEADLFAPAERDAVAYAHSKGVVVVSAAGNGTDSPATPWGYADWPASLPHVIGVAALRQDGSVPLFSNRDPVFVDIAAPGADIVSTIPRSLVDPKSGCTEPYSDCGPALYRNAIGTSFAAPQVSAAAALLLGVDPSLRPDQVAWLLERSATDVTAATCRKCRDGRDALSGWGRLDVAAALQALARRNAIPRADTLETNDDAGPVARPFGPPRTIAATLDYWDDPTDVYAIGLAKGETLTARLTSAGPLRLQLWLPGTTHVGDQRLMLSNRTGRSATVGAGGQLSYRARAAGTYFLEVRAQAATRDPVAYDLSVTRAAAG